MTVTLVVEGLHTKLWMAEGMLRKEGFSGEAEIVSPPRARPNLQIRLSKWEGKVIHAALTDLDDTARKSLTRVIRRLAPRAQGVEVILHEVAEEEEEIHLVQQALVLSPAALATQLRGLLHQVAGTHVIICQDSLLQKRDRVKRSRCQPGIRFRREHLPGAPPGT